MENAPQETDMIISNSTTSDSTYFSTRIQTMMQSRSNYSSKADFEIECSKDHWSQVVPACAPTDEPEDGESSREVFEKLKKHPQWGWFFWEGGDRLEVGRKIAEGGQAEIFEAKLLHKFSLQEEQETHHEENMLVLKVFKEGYSLRDLQKQWPLGMFQSTGHECCPPVIGGTLLRDDRFAFVMKKCWGDMRKLIDMRMQQKKNQGPPFPFKKSREFMWYIAFWMQGLLKRGILHRDVKASNVLISTQQDLKNLDPAFGNSFIYVADFECSIGVLGTTFWRAPEILLALKNRRPSLALCTEKTDVYSYAMTCYEIVTGRIPFEGHPPSDYDIVVSGQRPELPNNLDPRVKELITHCWHPNPTERPTFAEIIKFWKKLEY